MTSLTRALPLIALPNACPTRLLQYLSSRTRHSNDFDQAGRLLRNLVDMGIGLTRRNFTNRENKVKDKEKYFRRSPTRRGRLEVCSQFDTPVRNLVVEIFGSPVVQYRQGFVRGSRISEEGGHNGEAKTSTLNISDKCVWSCT